MRYQAHGPQFAPQQMVQPGSLGAMRAASAAHAHAPAGAGAARHLPASLAAPGAAISTAAALARTGAPPGAPAAAPEAPTQDQKEVMQAVVDALESVSATPAEPPVGSMTVALLRHQKLALGWMLAREGAGKDAATLCPDGGILADDQVCV